MVAKVPKRELRLLREEGHRGRSEIYKYVRLNLDTLIEGGVGSNAGPSWAAFADHLVRCGLTNAKGGPVSKASARQIFERARRDADKAKQLPAIKPPERKLYPRDMPKDWRPREVVVLPPKIDPGEPLAHLRANGPTPTTGPFVPEPDYTGMDNVERNQARMRWSIARRS